MDQVLFFILLAAIYAVPIFSKDTSFVIFIGCLFVAGVALIAKAFS